jgi:multidrug efflux pump subunit AcrA (membrane-fusion protein)
MRFLLQQSAPAKVRRRRLPFVAACAGAVVLGLAAGCQRPAADFSGQAGTAPETETPEVTVVKPARKNVRRVIIEQLPGINIQAYERTALYAKISGYVRKWHVDIGDRVRGPRYDDKGTLLEPGQLLAELYVPERDVEVKLKQAAVGQADAQIKQAGAAVQNAQYLLARAKSQYKRLSQPGLTGGSISQEVIEESELGSKAAQAALEKANADVDFANAQKKVAERERDYAQAMLDYALIRAPYDGVVTEKNISTDDFVQPADGGKGQPLYVVDKVDPVRVFVNVPDFEAVWLRDHDVAQVHVHGLPGPPLTGEVTRASGAMDPQTRTLRTEIDLRNEDRKLRPGTYADITIIAEHKGVWSLPAKAVLSEGDRSFCYRVENGRLVRTPVQVGLKGGDLVEVLKKQLSAPAPGPEGRWEEFTGDEEVVTSDPKTLTEGQPVCVAAENR